MSRSLRFQLVHMVHGGREGETRGMIFVFLGRKHSCRLLNISDLYSTDRGDVLTFEESLQHNFMSQFKAVIIEWERNQCLPICLGFGLTCEVNYLPRFVIGS